MKRKVIKITENPFVRNVVIMTTGAAAAQVITLALSPVITRLYGPEAIGLMGVFMAIVAILGPIAALTYPIAIVLPDKDSDAKGLIKLSLYISVVFAVLAIVIIFFLKKPIVQMFKIEDLTPFFYLIPLVIIFSGLLQVVEQWLIRIKQFGITAKVTFLQAFILNGSKVGIGFFNPIAAVLVVLSALGIGLKAFMLIILSRNKNHHINNSVDEKKVSLRNLAKKYNDFPLFRAPQVFIDSITQSIPILMLTMFFGPASVGFYSIGRSVLAIPSQLIGKSVGDVFYPRISEAANKGENLSKMIKNATLILAVIGIIPFGIIFIYGPWLFSFVFGAEWITAGEYARWLSLWMFFMFINQPSVRSLPVLSAQRFHLNFTVVSLIIRMGSIAIGYYVFSSDVIAISLFGISGALLSVCLILITIKLSTNFNKTLE